MLTLAYIDIETNELTTNLSSFLDQIQKLRHPSLSRMSIKFVIEPILEAFDYEYHKIHRYCLNRNRMSV